MVLLSFKDSELVSKVVPFLLHGIKDSALLVKKRTITACTRILPTALLVSTANIVLLVSVNFAENQLF